MSLVWTYVVALVIALTCVSILWVVSIPLKNVAIIDVWWSLGFVVMTTYYASTVGFTTRAVVMLLLQAVWAVRLAAYLFVRNHTGAHAHKEDFRYAKMREKMGPAFTYQSILIVFAPQAIVQFFVGTPLLLAVQHDPKLDAVVTITDVLGVVAFGVGLYMEARADRELVAWKQDPNNAGQLLTTGVWSWCRHPNYFGNALLWWGQWMWALHSVQYWPFPALLTVFAPALMTYCLVKVTGVALLEKTSTKKKPGFEAYAQTTPPFVPSLTAVIADLKKA